MADAAVVLARRGTVAARASWWIPEDAAADIAMLVGIGALFVYGVLIGMREGRGRMSIVLNALVVGSFGILILLLKVLVH